MFRAFSSPGDTINTAQGPELKNKIKCENHQFSQFILFLSSGPWDLPGLRRNVSGMLDSDRLIVEVFFRFSGVFRISDFSHIFWVSKLGGFREIFEPKILPCSKHYSDAFFGVFEKKY